MVVDISIFPKSNNTCKTHTSTNKKLHRKTKTKEIKCLNLNDRMLSDIFLTHHHLKIFFSKLYKSKIEIYIFHHSIFCGLNFVQEC